VKGVEEVMGGWKRQGGLNVWRMCDGVKELWGRKGGVVG
jgi:hypothetical protein